MVNLSLRDNAMFAALSKLSNGRLLLLSPIVNNISKLYLLFDIFCISLLLSRSRTDNNVSDYSHFHNIDKMYNIDNIDNINNLNQTEHVHNFDHSMDIIDNIHNTEDEDMDNKDNIEQIVYINNVELNSSFIGTDLDDDETFYSHISAEAQLSFPGVFFDSYLFNFNDFMTIYSHSYFSFYTTFVSIISFFTTKLHTVSLFFFSYYLLFVIFLRRLLNILCINVNIFSLQ